MEGEKLEKKEKDFLRKQERDREKRVWNYKVTRCHDIKF